MALMAIAQHHGRPATPTDQAHIESFFSHLKADWPHLTGIRDPAVLDTELARVRTEWNTVRLHAGIGYVTPDDEHHGRGPAIRRARAAGLKRPWAGEAVTVESSLLAWAVMAIGRAKGSTVMPPGMTVPRSG